MKKYIILLLIIALVGMLFTGCGTTKKVTEDDDSSVVTPEISSKVDIEKVVLNEDVLPDNHDWVTSTGAFAGVPGSTVEAFSGWPYSDQLLLGTTTVYESGQFYLDIGNQDLNNLVIYLVQTEQGKRKSDPIILTK